MLRYPVKYYWDKHSIEFMKECINKNMSAGLIARELTKKFNRSYTRNAVIGKCYRMNLDLNSKPANVIAQDRPDQFLWTSISTKMLTDLIKQGLKASDISVKMSEHYGVTISRSAIIGKTYRMNLNKGTMGRIKIKPEIKVKPETEEKFDPFSEKTEGESLFLNPEAIGVKFLDLQSNHCRFPVGDPKDNTLLFCGAPKIDLTVPYCQYCYQLCYTPARFKEGKNVNTN